MWSRSAEPSWPAQALPSPWLTETRPMHPCLHIGKPRLAPVPHQDGLAGTPACLLLLWVQDPFSAPLPSWLPRTAVEGPTRPSVILLCWLPALGAPPALHTLPHPFCSTRVPVRGVRTEEGRGTCTPPEAAPWGLGLLPFSLSWPEARLSPPWGLCGAHRHWRQAISIHMSLFSPETIVPFLLLLPPSKMQIGLLFPCQQPVPTALRAWTKCLSKACMSFPNHHQPPWPS